MCHCCSPRGFVGIILENKTIVSWRPQDDLVSVCVSVSAFFFCFLACVCVSPLFLPALHAGYPYGKADTKWTERPLTLVCPVISRAHLCWTQSRSSGVEISTQLSGGHMEQATFSPWWDQSGIGSHLKYPPHLPPQTPATQHRQGRVHRHRPSSYHATGGGHCLTLAVPARCRQNSSSYDKQN